MSKSRSILSSILFLALVGQPFAAPLRADQNTASGDVRIRIVGPDGKAIGHGDVDLTSTEQFARGDDKLPHVAMQTDERGIAQFKWPTGNARIHVNLKGHGYGTTGLIEVIAEKIVDAPLPPLAPYANIDGIIPDGDGADVTLGAAYMDKPVKVIADKAGHFAAELRGGAWWVRARRGNVVIGESGRSVVLMPGDAIHDLKLKPLTRTEQIASTQRHTSMREEPEEKIISWAEGTVRDDAGSPIAGATIYAAAVYHGGIRMYEKAEKATTDASGHYAIKGDAGLAFFSATLVAHKPGMTPAMAWITLPEPPYAEIPPGATRPTTRAATPIAPSRDFVLTARGGKLDVAVLVDKKPAVGANVTLFQEDANLRDTWAAGSGGAVQIDVEKIAYPRVQAGADGAAHFDFLPPGRYQVVASMDEKTTDSIRRGFLPHGVGPSAIADAIAVRAGETTMHRLNVYSQPNAAAIRAVRHDREPLSGNVAINWGRVGSPSQSSSGMNLDATGLGTHGFESPGLWHVALRYRDSPVSYVPLPEPYYSAEVVVAVSPRVAKEPALVTAMRFDAGSVSVDLRDVAGKPARGVVEIGQSVGEPTMIGSTDEQGRILFEHVPSGPCFVKGWIAGQRVPDLGIFDDAPLPADAELVGRTFVPIESVTAIANSRLSVSLQAQSAGYVRGTLRPPPGISAGEYINVFHFEDFNRGAKRDYLRSTGEFVVGPFSAGKTHLIVGSLAANDPGHEYRQEVTIEAGRLTTVDIKPPPPVGGTGNRLLGSHRQEIRGKEVELLTGHVYLADAKTPAYGASLHYFVPGLWRAHFEAMTDVVGNIHGRSVKYDLTPEAKEPLGSPEGPVIVAILPGSCGATIVEGAYALEKPSFITLPKPINLRGTVTLGGGKLTGQFGRFRVLAGYQGKGKLDGILSVWATPQDDGSFDLPGLTPGTYQVQAALDDIWLSNTTTITVDDHPPAPIQLDIGEPGGPALVECVGIDGKLLRGVSVIVERPAGPLATLYWPAEFTSDGAGEIWIPALETGKHRVGLKTGLGSAEFTARLADAPPVVVNLVQGAIQIGQPSIPRE